MDEAPLPQEQYEMRGNRVVWRSADEIVDSANQFCRYFRISRKTFGGMAEFIESLSRVSICVDLVDDDAWWWGTDAVCDPREFQILMPNDVYMRACAGDTDAVATVFHELGHLMLTHRALLHNEKSAKPCKEEDAEWQADLFAEQVMFRMGISSRQLSFDFRVPK